VGAQQATRPTLAIGYCFLWYALAVTGCANSLLGNGQDSIDNLASPDSARRVVAVEALNVEGAKVLPALETAQLREGWPGARRARELVDSISLENVFRQTAMPS
jgi:hypothetical protein